MSHFRNGVFAGACLLATFGSSVSQSAVLWDESIDGELTGGYGSAPIFDLTSGMSTISGVIDHELADPGELFDFDTFSVVVPNYLKLESIQLLPGYAQNALPLRFRVRPGAQVPGQPYLWTVTINNSSTPVSIAADVAAIGLDNTALTFNGSGSIDIPDFTYTWTFMTTNVPEPASWTMMIAGFGLVGGAMRRSQARRTAIPAG